MAKISLLINIECLRKRIGGHSFCEAKAAEGRTTLCVRGEQYNKLNKGSYFSTSCRKERVNCENKELQREGSFGVSLRNATRGVTTRCCLSWQTNSAQMRGEGCEVSSNEYSCTVYTWSPNKLWRSNSIFYLWMQPVHNAHAIVAPKICCYGGEIVLMDGFFLV
jgi:hypothetical protein